MKLYLFYSILVFIVAGCSTQKYGYNPKIYAKIYDCHKVDMKLLNKYREQVNHLDMFDYPKQNDTIYILEMNGIQGNYLFTAWNKSDTISYTNESGKLASTKNRLFTKYMTRLVSEWNLSEIKKEEETNSNLLPSETIYATKIVFTKGKYYIDCVSFKDFFNLQRDGMN
ncbi:MAG: hypothetical protein LBR26_01740 [Prevotella sp.]|jgi:hypothetical protein|nr:hypothetical protein [Prevotella sp.]